MRDFTFIDYAKNALAHYISKSLKGSEITKDDLLASIQMTWYNYTVRNYKAMFCITDYDDIKPELSGRYYEVTYIAKKDNFVIDEYMQKVPKE